MGMGQKHLEDSGTGIEMGRGETLEIRMAHVGTSETEMMINLVEGISEMTTGDRPEGMMTVDRLEGISGEGTNQGEMNRIGGDREEILRTDPQGGISEMMIGEDQDVISRTGTMIVDHLIGGEIVLLLHQERTENRLEDEKIQVIANVAVEWVAGEQDPKGTIQDHHQNETIDPHQDQLNQNVMTQQLLHHRKMGAGQLSANVNNRFRHEITA
jgi:hypothetical protein